ncbi:MAG: hypothetical protein LRS43_01090, partial [Desulfurococcales archaeon]|nr:hypothetical protein [Desulfurococcales archaeon]
MVRINTYIERTSLTLEEEAREVLEYKLRKAGINVKLDVLMLPGLEVNIYGVSGDTCVIGEVSTRAGIKVVNTLERKIGDVKAKYPDRLKPKIIKVIYTMWATDDAVESALQKGIWLVKASKELTPLKVLES